MGKENKKTKKNVVKYQTAEQTEIRNFIIVIVVVLLCVGAIYLLTRAFVTKDLFTKSEAPTTEEVVAGKVNYEVAIMGQILNRPYDEYYVAIYNSAEGDYAADMATLLYSYTQKEKHLHIYTVDLSNKLNDGYYDPENVNVEAKSLSELKVGDITLIKVKKGKISKYIVDYSKMEKELNIESK